MTTIKAIETRYAGCRFRSRLEARWAVFMDQLQIPWEYEPEGMVLDDGTYYLPDFWLPTHRAWLEVKGQTGDTSKWRKLFRQLHDADDTGYTSTVHAWNWHETLDFGTRIGHGQPIPDRTFMVGDVPRPDAGDIYQRNPGSDSVYTLGDYAFGIMLGPGSPHSGWGWGRCTRCEAVEIGHVGWATPLTCGHTKVDFLDIDILDAYRDARSARFEHGENG